ncbi:MAG: rod shape-determining protein [Firmicutes bacterium]|nr:rod shape-determining protein [Bacillota bacterium]
MRAVKQFAVDMGTANAAIYAKGAGVVLREPSVAAAGSAEPVRPIRYGVIADFNYATDMLGLFLRQAGMRGGAMRGNEALFTVPCGATEVERRAVFGAALGAGVKSVHTIAQPMAAAVGAGLAVGEDTGCMVAVIGAGVSEAAVISRGDIVVSRSVYTAGNDLDEAIIRHIKKKHGLRIDKPTAEDIKIQIGSASPCRDEAEMSIQGITITAEEIRGALSAPLDRIVQAMEAVLDEAPREYRADIARTGITLTGGGALLPGLAELAAQETGIPAHVAKDAADCVINGAGKCLEALKNYK